MRKTDDELGKFFARLLFCFLNSPEVTAIELSRVQVAGLNSFILVFEWFSKRISLQMHLG